MGGCEHFVFVFSTQAEASPRLLIIVLLVGACCHGDGKEDLSL